MLFPNMRLVIQIWNMNYGKMTSLFKKCEVSIGKNVKSNQLFRKLDYLILELLYMYLKKSCECKFSCAFLLFRCPADRV